MTLCNTKKPVLVSLFLSICLCLSLAHSLSPLPDSALHLLPLPAEYLAVKQWLLSQCEAQTASQGNGKRVSATVGFALCVQQELLNCSSEQSEEEKGSHWHRATVHSFLTTNRTAHLSLWIIIRLPFCSAEMGGLKRGHYVTVNLWGITLGLYNLLLLLTLVIIPHLLIITRVIKKT